MVEGLETYAAIIITVVLVAQMPDIGFRLRIWLLAIHYIGVFLLIHQEWTLTLSITFLLAGWVGGTVLGMALLNRQMREGAINREAGSDLKIQPIIAAVSGTVIILSAFTFGPQVSEWIPSMSNLQGGIAVLLIGGGIIHLSFHAEALPTTTGSLIVLTGFEILFAALTSSIFLAGMLSIITLSICLAGAYWITVEKTKEVMQ